ncbi:MAG: hypothetical protein AB2A00_30650 [Myxococcota bacterium]
MRTALLTLLLVFVPVVATAQEAPAPAAQESAAQPAPAPDQATPPQTQPAPEEPAPAATDANAPPALDANAPPALDSGAAPAGEAPPSMTTEEQGGQYAPPPLDSVAPADVPPPAERPFASRFRGMEVGLMAGMLVGGLLASTAIAVVSTLGAASLASGRLVWDFPLLLPQMVGEQATRSEGAKIFGTNAGLMLGGLFFSIMSSAVISGLIAAGLGTFSQDWETRMGPVVALGLLASGAVAAVGGTAFVLSLLVPVPLVWVATFAVAVVAGVLAPPLAVVIGQVLTKRARAVPGGILSSLPFGLGQRL